MRRRVARNDGAAKTPFLGCSTNPLSVMCEGVAALGGGGARGVAGRGDERPAAAGPILPSDYLGQQAMVAVRKDRRRVEVLRDAGRQLRTFNPEKPGQSAC
jgi:hypothetical protein